MLTTEETAVAAVVVVAPRVRPSHNFKWDEESDLLLAAGDSSPLAQNDIE